MWLSGARGDVSGQRLQRPPASSGRQIPNPQIAELGVNYRAISRLETQDIFHLSELLARVNVLGGWWADGCMGWLAAIGVSEKQWIELIDALMEEGLAWAGRAAA